MPDVVERAIGEIASSAAIVASIVLAALIDSPRSFQTGTASALGLLTLAETGLGVGALLCTRSFPKRVLSRLAPYAAFMVWAVLSVSWAPPRTQGLQNAAVYLSFLVLAAVSAFAAADDRATVERRINGAMLAADAVGLGLVVASVIIRGWPTNIDAIPWFVHPRALALFGLVPLSWHLARWALGNERAVLIACLWVAAIFFSLSRTATASAILLVLLASIVRARGTPGEIRRILRSQYFVMAVVPVVVVGILSFAPFRARFTGSASHGTGAREFQFRDNGRSEMWAGVMKSAAESPIIGKGLGTSESAVSNTYFWVGHPHNDFLRIYHDLGVVGLLFLVTSLLTWATVLWRDWRRRLQDDAVELAVLPLAALGVLLALVLGMLTDNSLVYGFVMAPTAVIVGAGLGARGRGTRRRRAFNTQQMQLDLADLAAKTIARESQSDDLTEKIRVRKRKRRSP